METHKPKPSMKKSSSINSEDSAQADSPLCYLSPMRSDAGDPLRNSALRLSGALASRSRRRITPRPSMAVDKFTQFRPQKPPDNAKSPSPVVMYSNRAVKEDAPLSVPKMGPNGVVRAPGDGVDGGGVGRSRAAMMSRRPPKRDEMVKTAALGFRVSELVLCLISFSVMAADKTQGWSGDSFDRYKEYRYCLAVTVIGFAYSAFKYTIYPTN
ncbi:hypothetical protein M0R45_024105 [Rubus argutus]|uniref:CASP-like protein n=1 Tax=Rubus argutus TaxID=59490 RepID=A0AAW1WU63_RUBAR